MTSVQSRPQPLNGNNLQAVLLLVKQLFFISGKVNFNL